MNDVNKNEGLGINPQTKQMDIDWEKKRPYDVIHPLTGSETMKVVSKNPNNAVPIRLFYGFQLQQSRIDQLMSQYSNNKNHQRQIANHSRDTIRSAFKNPSSEQSQRVIIDSIISHTVKNLNDRFPLSEYDTIISMPSSATLNNLLLEEIKKYTKPDVFITTNAFTKHLRKDVVLNQKLVDRENSEKTKQALYTMLASINRSHPDQPFSIKKLRSSFRRYFRFLKFVDPETQQIVKSHVENKKVLLVDDTFGEFATFKNAIDNISDFAPQSIDCFALFKDY
jgi:hypothetical protein